MTDLGWLMFVAIFLFAFLGSELSIYEDVQAWFKEIEAHEKRLKEEEKNKTK